MFEILSLILIPYLPSEVVCALTRETDSCQELYPHTGVQCAGRPSSGEMLPRFAGLVP